MTILPFDHHGDHRVGPNCFHVEEDRLKSEIKNGHQEAFYRLIFHCKNESLPLHHHGDYIMSPIVFILSEHVARYDNMQYG